MLPYLSMLPYSVCYRTSVCYPVSRAQCMRRVCARRNGNRTEGVCARARVRVWGGRGHPWTRHRPRAWATQPGGAALRSPPWWRARAAAPTPARGSESARRSRRACTCLTHARRRSAGSASYSEYRIFNRDRPTPRPVRSPPCQRCMLGIAYHTTPRSAVLTSQGSPNALAAPPRLRPSSGAGAAQSSRHTGPRACRRSG
jgi:hypothetical protein